MKKIMLFILLGLQHIAFAQNPSSSWKIWKTVTIGTFQKSSDIEAALKKGNVQTNELVTDMLSDTSFRLRKTTETIDLVKVSLVELGFTEDADNYEEICLKAKEKGLTICPAETGFQLRLQYTDQPVGESLHIAMRPIMNYQDFRPRATILRVQKGSRDMLLVRFVDNPNPDEAPRRYSKDYVFVFCLLKK